MSRCPKCQKANANYFMGTQLVCDFCDELLFDLEIELDDPNQKHDAPRPRQKEITSKIQRTKTK